MNFFRYKLIEDDGSVGSGILKLPYDNEPSVVTYLERHGNTVIFVKRISGAFFFLLNIFNFTSRPKVKRTEVAEILSSTSIMLKSGIPVLDALEEIVLENNNKALVETLDGIIFHLESGSNVTEAVKHFPGVFPSMVVQLIHIGEETGTLDRTMLDAANHLYRLQEIISDTKQALMYPAFVIGSMSLAMLFWFYAVVPTVIGLFTEMGVDLPEITVAILRASEFVQNYIVYIFSGIFITIYCIRKLSQKIFVVRYNLHKFFHIVPVIGPVRHASVLAFITEYFNLLLATGIDIFRSLEIITAAISDEVYKEKLVKLSESIRNGVSVTDSFRAAKIFPNFIIRMISVGEQTGTLSDQLHAVSVEYRKRLAKTVATIGKMLEPIVIIFAGVMFAVIVAGLFLPIYDLIEAVSV